ncbi:hypothetical protein KXJ72_17480 (plasmid) [Comamonas aquatica]|nr:hypothetical protein KXJ72_17480 [Comamonas aquatica]
METLPLSAFLTQPSIEHCLTEEELNFARSEQVFEGCPVVFLVDGQAVDIVTGQLQPKNTPPAARICYHHFSMDTAVLIAKQTKTKAEFVGTRN